MADEDASTVKAFMSYAWTSDEHQDWVLALAERLTQDGVEVLLDKWDLKVGHDANAFMEAMVTDPSVTKVLMVSDRVYAEKANGRLGGVGKEAQILTAEIYEKVAQDKYAALVTELKGDGKPYLPTYYGGRQYIDFSKPELFDAGYHDLLRWIYDKPKHIRPRRGRAPAFIRDPDAVAPGTTSSFRRAEHALRNSGAGAGGCVSDFGDVLFAELAALRPVKSDAEPWDEIVIRAAAGMRPALHHLSELILAEARYGGANIGRFLSIFEKIGRLMYRPPETRSWNDSDFDPFAMMCYEGFLSMVAILLAEQRFDLLKVVLTHPFVIAWRDTPNGATTTSYRVFSQDITSFKYRKNRLQSRQIDLYSDLIAETYKLGFPTFDQLVQADLLLYVRGAIVLDEPSWEHWWPRTLLYASRTPELFARSESMTFWRSWAPLILGDTDTEEFAKRMTALHEETRRSFGFLGPNLVALTNAQRIGSRS